MTLTSLVALAIIGISLVVSVVRGSKPKPKTFTEEDVGLGTRASTLPQVTPSTFIADEDAVPVRPRASILPSAAAKRRDIFDVVADEMAAQQKDAHKRPSAEEFSVKIKDDPLGLQSDNTGHMTEVEIKGVGLIYFPRDMSAKQIRDAMRRIIGSGFSPLPNATNQWRYSPASNGQ